MTVLSPITKFPEVDQADASGELGLLSMYSRFISDITIAMIRVKQAFAGASSATENKIPVT